MLLHLQAELETLCVGGFSSDVSAPSSLSPFDSNDAVDGLDKDESPLITSTNGGEHVRFIRAMP